MARYCPVCNARYQEGATFCPKDGATLLVSGHDNPASLVGSTIADRYEVVAQIATGGMGVIYKARQKLLDRYVALKVLPRELSNDPDTERRFFNEARAISQLRHPHIVTLFDFGRTADRKLFIAMEYVKGEPLAEHISTRPLPLASTVRIADQVLDALEEAHRMGIVHRDIKPDNVMLEVRGGRVHVRLLDFGIAKSELDTARHTKTGIVFGTPEYISPEQVLGEPLDHRADLYAVGLLLFEMLSGQRPFGGSGTAIAYKHAHDPIPSLLERFPDLPVPAALDALVYRLMSKSPDERPSTAADVRHLLQEATLLPPEPGYASGPLPPLQLDLLPDLGFPLPPFDRPADPSSNPGALTMRSGSPAPAAFPEDEAPPDPDPIDSLLNPVLGPRPPRPRSADAAPTLQAPAQLFERPRASRRPLVLGALLAIVGLGSLIASAWIERPLDADPIPPHPVPPIADPPPPDDQPPRWSDEILAGLTGALTPRPVPPVLKATYDVALLPSPRPEADALDAPERRAAISEARAALAALAPADPARAEHLRRIGDLEWSAANADYAAELARHTTESENYLAGRRDTAPAPPIPAYGSAVIAYAQLLEADPALPDLDRITAYLAHGLIAAGNTTEGLDRYRALIAQHPDSPWLDRAHLALADHAFQTGSTRAALDHYQALATRATDPRLRRYARYLLGHTHLALGHADTAVDDFHALLDGLRDDPEAATHYQRTAIDALTLAYTALPDGRRQAHSYFRGLGGEALDRRQSRLLALSYAARGNAAESVAAWRRAIEDTDTPIDGPGDRAHLLIQLAEQEAAAGHTDAARALIDHTLAACAPLTATPLELHCQVTRGNVLRAANHPEADATFARIADQTPAPGDPAAPYVAEARFRLAEPALHTLLETDPVTDAALETIDAAYRRVEDLAVPRWSVAARYRRAQARSHHATQLARRPADADRAAEARQQAAAHYTAAVTLARDHRIETRWASAAAEKLKEIEGNKPSPD